MPVSSSVVPWSLTMPAGSIQQWNFTFTELSSTTGQLIPYPISGATWEFVVRTTPSDLSTPVFSITTASTSAGQIVVVSTATLSQAQLTILPAATVSLNGIYYLSLWMNPSTTSALSWVSGQLIADATPQP